jgi:DNA-binding GntR family transcriptional regulator
VHRRPRAAASDRHSPFVVRAIPPPPARADLHYAFELAVVLESHAVARAATATTCDLRHVQKLLGEFDQAIASRRLARWAALELRLHRALDDQSGNQVLAAMAERTLRDGLTACPILSPDVLRVLQTHHRAILRRVEASQVDAAVRHTQAHLLFLRDVLDRAGQAGSRPAIGLRS